MCLEEYGRAMNAGRREFISTAELLQRMPQAAATNARQTKYHYYNYDNSGPPVEETRDAEFAWRIAELAVPAGQDVTIVAKPVYVDEAASEMKQLAEGSTHGRRDAIALHEGLHGNGERKLMLVDPDREDWKNPTDGAAAWMRAVAAGQPAPEDRVDDSMRFHFRILKGHTVETLLSQRSGSRWSYLGLGAAGVALFFMGLDGVVMG